MKLIDNVEKQRHEQNKDKYKILKNIKMFLEILSLGLFSVWSPVDDKKIVWDIVGITCIFY